ncbi:hypothetical protein H0N95_01375 [Candidatus Micrarchaeota archaeon]|nr:hypothetical protein [Candidatus Micrarchaeota archaeon]
MSFFKKITYAILNKKTEEKKWVDRIKIINELMAVIKNPVASEPKQYAKNVATDFYVDSIIVSKKDGSVLMNTEDADAFEKMVKTTSLYEYINSEFPDTRMMIVKDKSKYTILYTEKDLIYLFKTTGEVSIVEVKQMAKKINQGITDFSLK